MSKWYVPAFLCAALILSASEPSNITGTWYLNVERSDWGTRPKPVSVTLHIEHAEPALTYSGVVIYSGEDARPFGFSGSVDGNTYAMQRSFGSGAVVLRRIDARTFESVFRTSDGNSVETTRTSIGRDGRTLTRRIHLKCPQGTSTSTEVYERR